MSSKSTVKFHDKEVMKLLRGLKKAKNEILGYDVGFFEGRYKPKRKKSAKKRKTTQGVKEGPTIASVAFDNEFGTKHIPARPFFAIGNKKVEKKLIRILKKQIQIHNGYVLTTELVGILGETHQATIKNSIKALKSPPNTPATIKAKTSKTGGIKDNPLIDTGTMVAHVTYKIVREEE